MSLAGLIANGWENSGPNLNQAQNASYNLTPSSMSKIRTCLMAAQSDIVPFGIFGDSGASGYQVAGPETPDAAWPGVMATQLTADGYVNAGTLAPSADYPNWPQWTWGATWTYAGVFYYNNTAVTTCTYVSENVGGNVGIWYANNSPAFSFTIDGGAVHNVVPPGGAGMGVTFVTGVLPATSTHTIVITTTAILTSIIAIAVFKNSGVLYCNLAESGSGVLAGYGNVPGIIGNWSSSASNSVGGIRQGQLFNSLIGALAGKTWSNPIVGLCLGANDLGNGTSVAAIQAGYETILANSPNAAFFLVNGYRTQFFTDAVQAQKLAMLQALAIEHNLPLFDWDSRVGGYANLLANGLLQADSTHPTASVSFAAGQAFASAMVD